MKGRHYLVSGRVQGVGFRNFVFKKAMALGLSGQVRNLDDGRVEVVAWGLEEALTELETTVAKGPLLSNVTDVRATPLSESVAPAEISAGSDFTVTEDGAEPWSFSR